MMYAKLALENVKKSTKDYLIYIVTLTACISMFYAFLSISSNLYDPNIGAEFNLDILGDGIKYAILLKMCIRDRCYQTDTDHETGCMEFDIAKGRFSFRLTAPYSEERREAARRYAKENNVTDRLK